MWQYFWPHMYLPRVLVNNKICSLHYITVAEILLELALNTNQSINQSIFAKKSVGNFLFLHTLSLLHLIINHSFNVLYSVCCLYTCSQTCCHLYYAVTSIKQSPVLKGHIFLALSKKISYEFNLF